MKHNETYIRITNENDMMLDDLLDHGLELGYKLRVGRICYERYFSNSIPAFLIFQNGYIDYSSVCAYKEITIDEFLEKDMTRFYLDLEDKSEDELRKIIEHGISLGFTVRDINTITRYLRNKNIHLAFGFRDNRISYNTVMGNDTYYTDHGLNPITLTEFFNLGKDMSNFSVVVNKNQSLIDAVIGHAVTLGFKNNVLTDSYILYFGFDDTDKTRILHDTYENHITERGLEKCPTITLYEFFNKTVENSITLDNQVYCEIEDGRIALSYDGEGYDTTLEEMEGLCYALTTLSGTASQEITLKVGCRDFSEGCIDDLVKFIKDNK